MSIFRNVLIIVALAGSSGVARAQSNAPVTADSSHQPPVAAWASAGIGPSSDGLGAAIRANVSIGHLLLMYRTGDEGPFISAGNDVRDNALLIGMRSSGHRLFATAAIGPASAHESHFSDNNTNPTEGKTVVALAYDFALHANAYVPGLALSYSGVVGENGANYSAMTLSIELGWFGW